MTKKKTTSKKSKLVRKPEPTARQRIEALEEKMRFEKEWLR